MTHSEMDLKPGTAAAVDAFSTASSSCKGTGGLAGCVVESLTATSLPWAAHTDKVDVEVTNLRLDTKLSGAFCPHKDLILKGSVTLTPDDPNHATSFAVSGAAAVYHGTTTAFISNVTMSGSIAVTPSGTVGIAGPGPPEWSDNTASIESEANISYGGSLLFVTGSGGISCTETSAVATLAPGTTATIDSFTVSVAACKGTGAWASCTLTSATSTALPWTMHNSSTSVVKTGVHIDTTFHGAFCPYHEVTLSGSLSGTPDKIHAATKETIEGTLEARNGTSGAFIQNLTFSGSWNILPSGTYGITSGI